VKTERVSRRRGSASIGSQSDPIILVKTVRQRRRDQNVPSGVSMDTSRQNALNSQKPREPLILCGALIRNT